jgi:hypothetical protein
MRARDAITSSLDYDGETRHAAKQRAVLRVDVYILQRVWGGLCRKSDQVLVYPVSIR